MTSNRQRYTLRSQERLKLRKQIETLFLNGEAFSVFPLKVVFLLSPAATQTSVCRCGFSVPKKKHKHAVKRNLLKRRIKEAWRLNKHSIESFVPNDKVLHCFFIYLDHEVKSFNAIQKSMISIIERLSSQLN